MVYQGLVLKGTACKASSMYPLCGCKIRQKSASLSISLSLYAVVNRVSYVAIVLHICIVVDNIRSRTHPHARSANKSPVLITQVHGDSFRS